MMTAGKTYTADVHGGGGCDNAPSCASFTIDAETAKVIGALSTLIKEHDLHKVEKWDYRARFMQFDPVSAAVDAAGAGDENDVRTECDVLVVTEEEFYFSAYIKHTDLRVSCEGQPVAELMVHFGLAMPERGDHDA